MAVLRLGPLTVAEGQKRTLFFRVYRTGDEAEPVRGQVALTDRNVRFGNDGGQPATTLVPGRSSATNPAPVCRLAGPTAMAQALITRPIPCRPRYVLQRVGVTSTMDRSRPTRVRPAIPTRSIFRRMALRVNERPWSQITFPLVARGRPTSALQPRTSDKLVVGALAGHSTTTNLFFDDIDPSQDGLQHHRAARLWVHHSSRRLRQVHHLSIKTARLS